MGSACSRGESASEVCVAEDGPVAAQGEYDVAALRAEGPAGLERVLREYDAASGVERERLAVIVDGVAAQRYATVLRLYWYTDLTAARAAARASGKPILSLRMLGRLDEDRSCANSRFFRVALYGNAALSTWLRDAFVLHWSSERAVPKLTIDYGDGRSIETTIAGNSAHYVLDAEGRVLDVVPGLMTPGAFRVELAGALGLAQRLARERSDTARAAAIAEHHQARYDAIAAEWRQVAAPAVAGGPSAIARAEETTVAKAVVERPVVESAELGPSPTSVAANSEVWGRVGAELLARRGLERGPQAVLDAQSIALLESLRPIDWSTRGPLDAAGLRALQSSFAESIVADTGMNLTRMRMAIHRELQRRARNGAPLDFTAVNEWLYSSLFLTPATDPWLGLATPGTFTGLPRDGVK
ncbi:MAG TPA: hypothetical protein VFG69_08970 [Nannocystaceae bacterium]|nr:hypothetical protein [Nannocystaceae bacterium]